MDLISLLGVKIYDRVEATSLLIVKFLVISVLYLPFISLSVIVCLSAFCFHRL